MAVLAAHRGHLPPSPDPPLTPFTPLLVPHSEPPPTPWSTHVTLAYSDALKWVENATLISAKGRLKGPNPPLEVPVMSLMSTVVISAVAVARMHCGNGDLVAAVETVRNIAVCAYAVKESEALSLLFSCLADILLQYEIGKYGDIIGLLMNYGIAILMMLYVVLVLLCCLFCCFATFFCHFPVVFPPLFLHLFSPFSITFLPFYTFTTPF